jgi:hypothetical protein
LRKRKWVWINVTADETGSRACGLLAGLSR